MASSSQVLTGTLMFHDDLRQWLELKLDAPVCGAASIELVRTKGSYTVLEVLRGCRIVSRGRIDIAGTGYYSLNLFQDVAAAKAAGACRRQAAFPDYSRLRPPKTLARYHVSMKLFYQSDGPLRVEVTHGSHRLKPWQEYARYDLTGGFGFYAYCAEGFEASDPSGTAEGKPWLLDGYVAFDPESVPRGVNPILLGYDCARSR